MPIFAFLRNWMTHKLYQLNGLNLLLLALTYGLVGWLLLLIAGETALTQSFSDYIYYLMVTGSTVGYGDMSPTTTAGKWIVGLFIIPGGIGLFALIIGRLATMVMLFWRRNLLGKRRLNVNNHLLVIGWNEQKTLKLIELLQAEEKGKRPIVLCVRDEMENPFPGDIEFVRVNNYTDSMSMKRAAVSDADCIIIDIPEDDVTLSAALFCSNLNHSAHILVYFYDEGIGDLLKQHCPNVESIPSVSTEMLAKAAIDPGSSQLHHQLLNANEGMTQYAVAYEASATTIEHLFQYLKQRYQATLIAIDQGDGLQVNPELTLSVNPGDVLFYIANQRIQDIVWSD